jgi:hypothetical protein
MERRNADILLVDLLTVLYELQKNAENVGEYRVLFLPNVN